MEDDDDDFTFPTVAAEGQRCRGDTPDPVPVGARLPHLSLLPDLAAPASRPLWPFAASTATVPKTAVVTADEQAPVVSSEHRAEEEGEGPRRRRRVVCSADEETMDLLWEDASATTAPAPEPAEISGGRASAAEPQPPKQQRRAEEVDDAERMDRLWESFNEELLLLRRRGRGRSRSASADHPGAGGLLNDDDDPVAVDRWYLCTSYSPSDAAVESDDATCASSSSPAAERRGYGCAPTMLRASSRAGGAGQFCASPCGRRRRGAAAGWALLLRLFRRLFAVDKTSRSR